MTKLFEYLITKPQKININYIEICFVINFNKNVICVKELMLKNIKICSQSSQSQKLLLSFRMFSDIYAIKYCMKE